MKATDIHERRRRVEHLWGMGVTIEEMVVQLGSSKSTITRDLDVIRAAIREKYTGQDAQMNVINEIITSLRSVIREYWVLYTKARHESTKTGALNGIARTLEKKISILQSMGIIRHDLGTITTKSITPEELTDTLATIGRTLPEDHRGAFFDAMRTAMDTDDEQGGDEDATK